MPKGNRLWQILKGKRHIPVEPPPPVYWKDGQYFHSVCHHSLIKTDQRWEDKTALWCLWCQVSIMVRFPK